MLLSQTSDVDMERHLLRTMRQDWRFLPDFQAHNELEWHRVRLSAEPATVAHDKLIILD
jgi:hypothetical protein